MERGAAPARTLLITTVPHQERERESEREREREGLADAEGERKRIRVDFVRRLSSHSRRRPHLPCIFACFLLQLDYRLTFYTRVHFLYVTRGTINEPGEVTLE